MLSRLRQSGPAAQTGRMPETQQTGSGPVDPTVLRRVLGRSDMLGYAAADLAEAVLQIGEAAEQTLRAADRTGSATSRVAVEADAVALATGEMSAAMTEVSTSAAEATEVSLRAGEVVQDVVASVARLSASTVKIDDVVRVVSGISDQTRLLALNATIEAARAGSAGRGFAVVAEEVKNLANDTTTATEQIASQLAELADDGRRVQEAVHRIETVLVRITELQQTIGAAVEEQAAVISEITRAAGEVASSSRELEEWGRTSDAAARTSQDALEHARLWITRLRETSAGQREDAARLQQGEPHPLRQAVAAHAAWRTRLADAIAAGPAGIDGQLLASSRRDDACAFGQWLATDAATASDPARAVSVRDLHARFHAAAADVLQAVAHGDREGAVRLTRAADGYGGIAPALMEALMSWLVAVGES